MPAVRAKAAALLAAALVPLGPSAASAAPTDPPSAGNALLRAAQTQPPTDRASEVRAALAAVFQAHAAFAALTQTAALAKGPQQTAAATAMTAGLRQELAAGIGGLSPRAAALRDAMARNDAAELAYARAVDRYRGNRQAAVRAQQAIVLSRRQVIATLAPLVPNVSRDRIGLLLAAQDAREAAAARALGARSPRVYALVQQAHLGTAALARAVAAGLDARDQHGGSATSPLAELRASTINLTQAHVVQTGLASDAGLTYGLRSAAYGGAAAALATNTAQLTERVRELSGPANAATFQRQWQRHVRDYAQFVNGIILRSAGRRTGAAVDLGDFVRDVAPTLARVTGVAAADIVPDLRVHVTGTLTVIRLQAQHDPDQYPAALLGALHFAGVGDAIALTAAERLELQG